MKILELIDSLAPGGGERFVVDLSNALSLQNQVSLVKFRDKRNADFYNKDVESRVKLISYPGKFDLFSKVKQIFEVIRIIKEERPDIVHAHLIAFNYIIIPVLIFNNIKFYYTVHNVADRDTNSSIDLYLKKWFFKRKVGAVTISELCERSFINLFGFKSKGVIENGCRNVTASDLAAETASEIARYKKTSATKVYVNIARLMEQKNHELLIQSFNEFAKENDAVLLIIGDYENNMILKEKLDQLITTDAVFFLGTKNNVGDYLLLTDFFCLSSKWEGLPISLLEAGICGTFPICTPVGGIPDVIINETWGILTKDLTVASYVEALERSFKLNTNREEVRRRYTERYLMSICADKYEQIFK
ncbi:glycosyltransferase [Sphingobacterium psychroaquaticum]|uniref:glycosyltransferase n=1 Tax=Sphingobacterium psychroaquaticum TaxID=561061 RepID=UPI00106D0F9D|nr:glycosyltransferase [Sphingobacterium psychroaquaticum]QBQ39825.1 glycosyltransferase [Sphingobacterium psychroaquaticum]